MVHPYVQALLRCSDTHNYLVVLNYFFLQPHHKIHIIGFCLSSELLASYWTVNPLPKQKSLELCLKDPEMQDWLSCLTWQRPTQMPNYKPCIAGMIDLNSHVPPITTPRSSHKQNSELCETKNFPIFPSMYIYNPPSVVTRMWPWLTCKTLQHSASEM